MSSTKASEYVKAALSNPEFIKIVALCYGNRQQFDGQSHSVCTMSQIAKAALHLENAIVTLEKEEDARRGK